MSSKTQIHGAVTTSPKQEQRKIPAQKLASLEHGVFSGPIQRATFDPRALTPDSVLELQRTIGNGAVVQLLSGTPQHASANPSTNSAEPPFSTPASELREQHINTAADKVSPTHCPAIQRKWLTKKALSKHYVGKPTAHPEWPRYQKLMKKSGFDSGKIEIAWQLLLGGLLEQEKIEKDIKQNPTLSRAEQNTRRDANTWFKELTDLLSEQLRIKTETMALWSGGIEISKYAQKKGHTPLELSPAGKVFNELEMHQDWALKGPMWNALSRAFVKQAPGVVHIFMRAYDPESVLIEQEIPDLRRLQSQKPDVKLFWHPLYTDKKGRIKEISPDFQLVNDAAYTSRDQCVAVMYNYLLYHHNPKNKKAKQAVEGMNKELSKNVFPRHKR